jgi:DNA-binding response OmpR family regulator
MPRLLLQVCSQIRDVFGPLELPIVLLSSRSGEADMLAALERGVNDFLIKPLRRTELLARINSQVGALQEIRPADSQPAV